MSTSKEKILLAMSGGVDSSASAILLQEKGYEVIGITLNFGKFCCNPTLISDAKKIAKMLNIEHFVIDCELNFEKGIVDYFMDSYLNGQTPNPCAKCNRDIKFKKVLDFADELGIYKVATGHYARILQKENGEFTLNKSFNLKKDQSYFLSMLKKEYLSRIEFPLGEFKSKDEVRELAKKHNLPVASKKDSQDICFIPDDNYKNLILQSSKYSKKTGDIILKNTGKKIGEHDGILNYTIGQRKGLGLAFSEPLYVVSINKDDNTVFVGTEEHLYSSKVNIGAVNILDNSIENGQPFNAVVKLRSTHKGAESEVVLLEDGSAIVKLKNPEKSITKGQICAGYIGDQVVFGGWIK